MLADCQQLILSTDTVRGLQFILGWEKDRIFFELPVGISWTLFGLAVIWLCVIFLGGSAGQWDFAMAFGQLLAASMTLLIYKAKD